MLVRRLIIRRLRLLPLSDREAGRALTGDRVVHCVAAEDHGVLGACALHRGQQLLRTARLDRNAHNLDFSCHHGAHLEKDAEIVRIEHGLIEQDRAASELERALLSSQNISPLATE